MARCSTGRRQVVGLTEQDSAIHRPGEVQAFNFLVAALWTAHIIEMAYTITKRHSPASRTLAP
jgi:hypothetical protein